MAKRRFPIIGYLEDGRPVFAQAGGDGSDEGGSESGSGEDGSEEEDKGGSGEGREGGEDEKNPPVQGISREEVQQMLSEAVHAARDDERQKAEQKRQRDKDREGLTDAQKVEAERDDARAELEEVRASLETERRRGSLKDAALAANVSADGVEFVLDALGSREGKPETLVKALVDKFPALVEKKTARTGGDFTGGDEQPQLTKEEFNAMGYSQRVELLDKHPEVYKRFDPIP